MPFGAHETMETHEILSEKINCITHFNLYAREAKHPRLRDMVARHLQEEILSYNQIVAYTHDYIPFRPIPPNTDIHGITPQSIQYGLNNPPQNAPQADTTISDREIAMALLWHHKNGARNSIWASLEIADPNLRRMMMNSAVTCVNQAYEVFLFMNEQGAYQVPTLNDHTAKTLLHSYQPVDTAMNRQFGVSSGQQSWQQGVQQPWRQQGAQQSWQQGVQQPWQQGGQQSWQQAGQQPWQQGGQQLWQQAQQQAQQQRPESWQQSWAQWGNGGGNAEAGQGGFGGYNASNQNAGAGTNGSPLNVASTSSAVYGEGGSRAQSQNPGSQTASLNRNQAGDLTASAGGEEEDSITQ